MEMIDKQQILNLSRRKGYAVNGWEEYIRVSDIEQLPSVSRKGKWIRTYRDGFGNLIGYCNKCGRRYPVNNFCPNCGADMRNTIKPKSCFECEYSVDYSDDTVMCSEIKNMVSTSQNHDMIPPFCPKYVGADMREGDSE